MTRPAKVRLHNHGLNTNSVGLLQDGDACDVVVPFEIEDGAELSLVEFLAAVEQSGDYNRLVDHEFGGSAEAFFLKDSFIKFT